MNKIVLSQALKFKDNIPSNNQIKILIEEIKKYQKDNELYFFDIKHRQKPEILNEKDFFKFLSDINELKINNFEDIEFLLEESISRKDSILKTGDSKEYFAKVFDKVILFQIKDEKPILYKNLEDINFDKNKKILAVENGETFLNIFNTMSKFGFEQFIYLSGYPNILTKNFLLDKDVVFFLDYDIEAIKIYDSIKCKSKKFFKFPDIEKYFENKTILNKKLYLKQRNYLQEKHPELQWLINLIKKHSGVLEQEIFN